MEFSYIKGDETPTINSRHRNLAVVFDNMLSFVENIASAGSSA